MSACIELKDVVFSWPGAPKPTLRIPHWQVARGQQVMLQGASGSGKSTLLSLLAGIHQSQAGQVLVLGHDLNRLSGRQRDRLRANEIGYIFQQFNLLPYLSALQNVLLAAQFAPARRQRIAAQGLRVVEAAQQLLTQLGFTAAQQHAPAAQLSVGQQQRVAAARALLGAPALIIADEPTSALDQPRRDAFIDVLFQQCQAQQSTLLFVTHDPTLAPHFPQVLELSSINQVPVGDVC